jgi:hypothetical protein
MPTTSTPTDAPPSHEGAHYENPVSKPIVGPHGLADHDAVQRVVWPLFLVLILCVVAMGVVLGMIHQPP